MKYEIMIKMLFLLIRRRLVSAAELAREFEISRRSVYRYVEALGLSGVPVYYKRGRYGGVMLVDSFVLPASFLSEAEYDAVTQAMAALESTLPSKALRSAKDKLAAVKCYKKSELCLNGDQLVIDGGPWGDSAAYRRTLEILEKSVVEREALSIRYHDASGEITARVIEPYTLVLKQGLWYVYSYCRLRRGFRLFKVGRIAEIIELKERFSRDEKYKYQPIEFTEEKGNVFCEFELSATARSEVEEWLGVNCVSKKNGILCASATLPYNNGLIAKILGFGAKLKVVSPIRLRNDLKKSILELYNSYEK